MNPDKILQKTKFQLLPIVNHNLLIKSKNWFLKLSLLKKILLLIIIVGVGWFGYTRFFTANKNLPTYQTAQAERGTLVVTVSGSGQASTANNSSITTEASGVVSKVYVKDGDEVKAGDKIAEIDLDLPGQQNAAQALASYQSAKNSLDSANVNLYTLRSDMFTKWDTYFNLATNGTYQNSDGTPNTNNRTLPEYITANDNWLAAEGKYKNQQNVVAQAQTSLNSAWLSYQQTSSIIYAPISGVVSGLSLQPGSVIATTQSSSSSNSTQSPTKIAGIKTKAYPTVTVNLTEIDIPKIKINDKATIMFDALTDKTFTGKVISIDTSGVVSSGVTTYPTVIKLDTQSKEVLSNMAATANIITNTKDNTLLVPSSSVQTRNGSTFIRVIDKNNLLKEVPVEIGLISDTQTEITSGISEGDMVVTSIVQSSSSGSSTRSPFSSFSGGGGNAIRINRNGR